MASDDTYPLNYCEATSKAVNLTIDQELLRWFYWLHIVKTAGGGALVCNVLAVWLEKCILKNEQPIMKHKNLNIF